MIKLKNNSFLYKILFGKTQTKQVSGASYRIVNSKDLSVKLYSKIDDSDNFSIKGKDGKIYKIKQLMPSR